jgi:hypothetical protein
MDLAMLVGLGGQERTVEEYAALAAEGGFRLARVVPTASPVSVIELVPLRISHGQRTEQRSGQCQPSCLRSKVMTSA